jgi:hypothetical protein
MTKVISDQLKRSLRNYFRSRVSGLKYFGGDNRDLIVASAALEAVDTGVVQNILGALVCDQTNPLNLPSVVNEASELHDALLRETDSEV